MSARLRRLVSVLPLGLALAACGTVVSPSPTESQMPMAPDGMEMEIGALGEPADPADADRTVQIVGTDQLVWDPDAVEVQVGETITFEIENPGTVEDHEFVLGSAEYQQQHEEEMLSGEMEMHEEENAVDVPVGETASITWRFTEAGTTQFGCHEPAHFPAGMVGTITVSE